MFVFVVVYFVFVLGVCFCVVVLGCFNVSCFLIVFDVCVFLTFLLHVFLFVHFLFEGGGGF